MSLIELGRLYKKLRLSVLDEKGKSIGVNKFADKIHLPASRISELENGKREMSLTELKAYHSFFNVSFEYLLGETEHKTTNESLSAACNYTGLSEEAVEAIKQSSFEWALNELLETELAEGGIISLILEYTTNAPTCPSGEELILSKNGDIRFVEGDVDVHDGVCFSDFNALHDRTVMRYLDIYNTFMLNLINDRLSILKNKTHKEIIKLNAEAKAQMVFLKQREQELQAFFELHPNGGLIPIEETDLGKALQAKTEKEASDNAKHNPKKE